MPMNVLMVNVLLTTMVNDSLLNLLVQGSHWCHLCKEVK